jgi:hypothetical protein
MFLVTNPRTHHKVLVEHTSRASFFFFFFLQMRFQSIPRAARKFAEDNLLPARRAWRKFAKDNPMKAGGLAGLAGGLAEAGEAACENISVQLLFFQEASRSKMEKDLLPPGASKICVSMTEAELGEAGAKLHTKILQTDAREIFAADASPM